METNSDITATKAVLQLPTSVRLFVITQINDDETTTNTTTDNKKDEEECHRNPLHSSYWSFLSALSNNDCILSSYTSIFNRLLSLSSRQQG